MSRLPHKPSPVFAVFLDHCVSTINRGIVSTTVTAIQSESRTGDCVWARHILCNVLRRIVWSNFEKRTYTRYPLLISFNGNPGNGYKPMSLALIGAIVNKDHTSVIYALKCDDYSFLVNSVIEELKKIYDGKSVATELLRVLPKGETYTEAKP